MNKTQAIVVGSGIAGLAASIRLACKGLQVDVFEKNAYIGGKLTEVNQAGFRFDAGPSLFTLPEEVDALFLLAGENPRDHFNYHRLAHTCHYFWEDGTRLQAPASTEEFAKEVKNVLGVEAKIVSRYLAKSRMIYQTTEPVFLRKSLHIWKNYVNRETAIGLLRMPRLGIFSNMHSENLAQLGSSKLVQLFDRYATYNGSDPYLAPAVLQSIPHLEFERGAWFPQGGMHAITSSLTQLAKRLGVEFHLNEEVEEIVCTDQTVKGIKTSKATYDSTFVVCNSDVVPAYRKLLQHEKAPEKTLAQARSTSALIFYWGIQGEFPELDMHNIFFSQDYQEEFRLLREGISISDDPTVYVNLTSHVQPEDAPPGCQNWFVMVNVPCNTGQNWDELITKTRKNILKKLSFNLKRDIESIIVCESMLTPMMIEQRTSSFGGALYGSASNNRNAAFLRHANFSSRIRGLYFCGGSVHPGGGIPLCLMSAEIVANLIPDA